MKKFNFLEEVTICLEKAYNIAQQRNHKATTTSHCFLSVFSYLKNRVGEPYETYRDKVIEIMRNHGLHGDMLKQAFKTMYPEREPDSDPNRKNERVIATDLQHAMESLQKLSLRDQRMITLVDLIRELFSDKSYDLHMMMELALGGSTQETDKMAADMVEYFKSQAPKMTSIKDFENVKELTNLNKFVKEHPQKFVNMEHTIDQIRLALSCKNINCACLVGKAGTGKTAAVYAFAQAINEGKANGFNQVLIYQLDIAGTVSGSRFRGDFEEKLLNIINLLKKYRSKVLVFIDEIHTLMKSGAGSDGALDGANILKPYISRGEIQIIGATTQEEYAKYIETDKAMARRFQKILINEPTPEETRQILEGIRPEFDEYFGKKASDQMIDEVMKLCGRYSLDLANPSKAITILDTAYAHSKVFNENNELVLSDDAVEAINLKFNITVKDDRVNATKKALFDQLLGQEEPLNRLVANLKFIDKGLVNKEQPLFSAILCGSTGTGKTASAEIIAEHFFGSKNNLVKINCGEYSEASSVTKITGASPSFVGYDDEPDIIKSVKNLGACVVLIDEIEKAHPDIFDVFLSILDKGEMKTNKGDLVSFRNCIILFTTNIGYSSGFSKEQGLGFNRYKIKSEEIIEKVKKHFRPEFINRVSEIILFNSLDERVIDKLVERYRKEYELSSGEKVEFNEADIEEIKKEADVKEYGARGIQRAVRKQYLKKLEEAESAEKEEKELFEIKT